MLIRLLAAFIFVPLIELALLLQLADATSAWTAFAVVIVTGVIGSILARHQGVMAWFRFRSALAEGRVPNREIRDGLMIVFAAALLLTPGLLTDALGFTLLTPPGRALIGRWVVDRYVKRFSVQMASGQPASYQESMYQESMYQESMFEEPLHRQSREGGYTIDAEVVDRKS
jgi:UPF0716 protein FxsA